MQKGKGANMEVLYLSMVKPYKKVPNAGGQTFYYYIEALSRCEGINITLISKVLDNEDDKCDIQNVNFIPIRNKKITILHPIRAIADVFSKINPYNRRGTTLRKSIYVQFENELKRINKTPDVVVLEFTQMLLMIDIVKKYFPNAKIFASEHDVSFLRCKREAENEKNIIKKIYKKIVYKTMLKYEILGLGMCDLVMPHNDKDKKLLLEKGISENKIFTLVPYYNKSCIERNVNGNDILFYGAMSRKENYESAIWFINHVMPLLEDTDVRFIVVGANPVDELKKMQTEKVIVTGFVDSVMPYFEKCLCMVAPLLSGAGIKIKVIEAMVSGVPVLTNEIGIEGIPAIDKEDYVNCITPEQYAETIRNIMNGSIDTRKISESAKEISNKFNIKKSFDEYKGHILDVCQ